MADHIKYAVSVDMVDEYTATTAYTNDENNNAGSDVAATAYRHYSAVGGAIGSSVTATTQATGGIEIAGTVTNFSSGTPTYTSLAADGTKVLVGAENTVYDGMFIRHTGFTDTDFDTATYQYIAVFVEYSNTNYALIASIPSGGSIFLPHTAAHSGGGYYVAASNNVAAGTSSSSTVLAQLVTIT
jgi:hypothetical protein